MNSTSDATILLMGLTGTGKTTFLVALDAVLDSQTDANGLKHAELAAERGYLQPLKEKWLRGEVLDRTNRQPPPPHQLVLVHERSGRTIGLSLPDLAGETFDEQFVTRSIPQDLWERLERADGLLLFVRCDDNANHTLLEDPRLMDPAGPAPGGQTALAEGIKEWRLEQACPQVKLVDLLQFVSERPQKGRPLRVAVMISAWDLVEKAHDTKSPAAGELPNDPEKLLEERWALLKQFLDNNSDVFDTRAFGVSARGGDGSKEETARLTALDCASERVILVDGNHRSNDLTRPIRWLLGIEEPVETPNA